MYEERTAEELERELIGARAVYFCLRHGRLLGAFAIGFALLGFGLGALTPRPYESSAAIEIGGRLLNEPLEKPMIVRERLLGILERNRARFPGILGFALEIRKDAKTHAATKTIDVDVRATTSSTARGILDASLSELLEVHGKMHAFEDDVSRREHALYEKAAEQVDAILRGHGGQISEVVDEKGERREKPLTGALIDITRRLETTSPQLIMRRAPPTRIVEGPSVPRLKSARAPLFLISGFIFGLMIAIGIAILKDLVEARPSRLD